MSVGSQPGHLLNRDTAGYASMDLQDQLRMIRQLTGISGTATRAERRALAKKMLGQNKGMSSGFAHNASTSRLLSMGRMSPNGLRGLLLGILQERLDQLVLDSLSPRLRGGQRQSTLRFDTSGLDALMEGVSLVSCPEAKAIVFQAAVRGQDLMEGYEEAEALSSQIAALLHQDLQGIFTSLRALDPEGNCLISYLKMMFTNRSLEAKQQLKDLLSSLMHGERGHSFTVYMEQFNTGVEGDADAICYGNASNLGYVTGATKVALSAAVIRSREQAAILNNIFLGALKASAGVTGQARKTQRELEKLGFYYIISELDKGELDLLDALYNLAFPRTEQGRPKSAQEGPGLAFKESFDHIVLSHQR